MNESANVHHKRAWKVESRDDWDILFRRSVPYYWYWFEKHISARPGDAHLGDGPSLYDIFHEMGVSNITKPSFEMCSAEIMNVRGVVFYRDDVKEKEFILVRPVTAKAKFREPAEFKPDGWHNLYSELTIKIPQNVLLPRHVLKYLENFYDALQTSPEARRDGIPDSSLIGMRNAIQDLRRGSDWPTEEEQLDSLKKLALHAVEIDKLLVFMGQIDWFFKIFHNNPPEIYNTFRIYNNEICNCLTALLAQWIELECYFPFGFIMTSAPVLLSPCPMPNCYITDKILTTTSTCLGKTGIGAWQDQFIQSNTLTKDRGGAGGLSMDYEWEHFAPRLVSLNWQSIRDLKGGIKDKDRLSSYPALLASQGFHIPPITDIIIRLEKSMPAFFQDGELVWNPKGYMPELDIDYPAPPAPRDRPMALSDLLATRANEPFTSF